MKKRWEASKRINQWKTQEKDEKRRLAYIDISATCQRAPRISWRIINFAPADFTSRKRAHEEVEVARILLNWLLKTRQLSRFRITISSAL